MVWFVVCLVNFGFLGDILSLFVCFAIFVVGCLIWVGFGFRGFQGFAVLVFTW